MKHYFNFNSLFHVTPKYKPSPPKTYHKFNPLGALILLYLAISGRMVSKQRKADLWDGQVRWSPNKKERSHTSRKHFVSQLHESLRMSSTSYFHVANCFVEYINMFLFHHWCKICGVCGINLITFWVCLICRGPTVGMWAGFPSGVQRHCLHHDMGSPIAAQWE